MNNINIERRFRKESNINPKEIIENIILEKLDIYVSEKYNLNDINNVTSSNMKGDVYNA